MLKIIKINLDNECVAYLGYDNEKIDFHVKTDRNHNLIVRKDSAILAGFKSPEELLNELESLSSTL